MPQEDHRRAPTDDEALVDSAFAANVLGFAWRSVRRHWVIVAIIMIGSVGLGVLGATLLPKHYIIATKMLADKNFLMPALIERRSLPSEGDAPTRLATEAVMNRENLQGIVRETNLVQAWPSLRSPLGKLRDAVLQPVSGPMSDSARVNALVDVLRGRMSVETSEGTVSIQLDWMDAVTGYKLVQAAQRHFFAQRRASEIAMIEESIRILEEHVATAQQAIQDVLATMPRSTRRDDLAGLESLRPQSPRPASPELTMLLAALQAKTQTIAALETSKNDRVAALQSRLAELRGHYGPAHPEVVSLEENIKNLAGDSPRVRDLRMEEAALRTRIAALGGPPAPALPPTADPGGVAMMRLLRARGESGELPETMYAKSRLKIATAVYEELLERLEGARLGLETASAAFKYRYTIVTPPELPSQPVKPNVPVLIVGSLFLGIMLGIFAAVGLDVTRGYILQPWQITRQLGLPVLAEVGRS